jgi:hypothetical protein
MFDGVEKGILICLLALVELELRPNVQLDAQSLDRGARLRKNNSPSSFDEGHEWRPKGRTR